MEAQTTEALVHIYTNRRHEYREEALQIIEQVLINRNVSFDKIVYQPPAEKPKVVSKPVKVDGKVFRKVLVILLAVSVLPVLSHFVYLEGKLFTDDHFFMFFHKLFNLLGFPLVLLAGKESGSQSFAGILLYLVNILLLSRIITYFICWLRKVN